MAACSSPVGAPRGDASPGPEEIDEAQRSADAATLLGNFQCAQSYELADDLQFWDAMRGADCVGVGGTDEVAFVRVYARAASVPQVLDDWGPTLVGGRGVVRGAHWFVIGPEALLGDLETPESEPAIGRDAGTPAAASTVENSRTTCVRFIGEVGLHRALGDGDGTDTQSLEAAFPGTLQTLDRLLTPRIVDAVRAEPDPDERVAPLSVIGPELKRSCARAEGNSDASTFDGVGG